MLLSLPRQASRNLDENEYGESSSLRMESEVSEGSQPDGSGGRALVDEGLQRLGKNNRHVPSVDLAEREKSIRPTLEREKMIICTLEKSISHSFVEKDHSSFICGEKADQGWGPGGPR